MARLGLLLVMMEPPAGHDEEFQAWYDTEHMPQRRSMPGFLSAARWECVSGWPRWLALYDLESPGALETPQYLAVAGPRSTPWTKRILGFANGYQRIAAEQVEPGQALASAGVERLLVTKYNSPEEVDRLRGAAGLVQLRVFKDAAWWVVAGFSGAVTVERQSEELWNEYSRYENPGERDSV